MLVASHMGRTIRKMQSSAMRSILAILIVLFGLQVPASAQGQAVRVNFPRGQSSTVVKGRIAGFDTKDYLIRARIGQTMSLHLTSSNPYTYFIIYSINGHGNDMMETTDWTEVLNQNGDYQIRVFMMRAGARRPGAVSNYSLSIAIE